MRTLLLDETKTFDTSFERITNEFLERNTGLRLKNNALTLTSWNLDLGRRKLEGLVEVTYSVDVHVESSVDSELGYLDVFSSLSEVAASLTNLASDPAYVLALKGAAPDATFTGIQTANPFIPETLPPTPCLLYTSDAADE